MTDDQNALAATPDAPPAILSLGARLAKEDPEVLETAVVAKLDELKALMSDSSLDDRTRQAARDIVAKASPNRPGLEEMPGAWNVPRVNIAQPTTRDEKKPEGTKNGGLYTTEGKLLEMPWGGIPISFFEENINFGKGVSTKAPICQSPDGKLGSPYGECVKCPYLPFGKQNEGRGEQKMTDCYANLVVIMLASDLSGVYKLQFGKTSRKTGNVMLQLARQQQAIWNQSYLINTEKKSNDAGLYWIYTVQSTGKNNPEPVLKLCDALWGLYTAERHRFLASWYSRPQQAAVAAAQAEGEFQGGALDAGIGGTGNGVEPNFETPVTPPPSSNARSSSKPM